MGSRLAARFIAAGHDLSVWSRNADRSASVTFAGARWAASPADAAAGADYVLSIVRDDEASRAVWIDGGALAALPPQSLAIEMSTLSVSGVRALGDAFGREGKRLVEAPVLGSLPQVEAGALIVLCGGERTHGASAEPVLAAISCAVHHLGPLGAGAAMKLYVNAMLATQAAALAELGPLLEDGRVDPEAARAVVDQAPVFSPAARGLAALMTCGDHAPRFPVELVEKDLGYALATGARLPITESAKGVFTAARLRGLGGENISAVAKLYGASAD